MSLTSAQKRQLRTLGHKLRPVVSIGNKGVSANVLTELDIALEHHELIKVKITGADREEKKSTIETLCDKSAAELVQQIGNIALLYKANKEKPRITLGRL